jgi:catechol 2,3-dioxygenase-like lactoylglutathione lyase family enzyme
VLALADVAVVVSDAKKSAQWWKEKLGFGTFTMGGTGHAVLVAPPGERLVLHLCEGFAPLEPGDTGIAFVTDRIEQDCRRMREMGVEFPEPLRKESWGAMAKFADPDRNVFWLLGVPTAMVKSTLASRAPTSKVSRRPPARKPARRARRRRR